MGGTGKLHGTLGADESTAKLLSVDVQSYNNIAFCN